MALNYSAKEAQLVQMAATLGFSVMPIHKLKAELTHSIASRMMARKGDKIYQSAAHSIANFPLALLQDLLPDWLITTNSASTKTCVQTPPSLSCPLPAPTLLALG